MKKINVGLIGLGNQGKSHLQNCLLVKDIEVGAVADSSNSALNFAKKAGVKKCYANYEDLLADKDVDAVIISLPNFLHAEAVIKAAEARKDILLEKPLARNVQEAEEMLTYVRRYGVKLMVGYDLRFRPLLKGLQEKISDGFFGEIEVAEAVNISNGPFTSRGNTEGPTPVPSWWFDKSLVGGGVLLDLGSHMIDVLVWYFGEPESAKSFLGYNFNLDVEDTATCVLKFRQGTIGVVNVGWFSKGRAGSINLYGTAGVFSTNLTRSSTLGFIWNDITKKLGVNLDKSSTAELEHFVQSIQNDIQPSPSGEEALVSLRAICTAYDNADKFA
jgi:predicted dehydrogenase